MFLLSPHFSFVFFVMMIEVKRFHICLLIIPHVRIFASLGLSETRLSFYPKITNFSSHSPLQLSSLVIPWMLFMHRAILGPLFSLHTHFYYIISFISKCFDNYGEVHQLFHRSLIAPDSLSHLLIRLLTLHATWPTLNSFPIPST